MQDFNKLHFQTRAILIHNNIEPSERNMAKAYGLSRTTYKRKIESNFIKIPGFNSILAKHGENGVGPLIGGHTLVYVSQRWSNLNNVLINYLCIMGLPFTGILNSKDPSMILETTDIESALSISLYHSLRKHKHFHTNLSFGNGLAYSTRVNNLFKRMAMSGYRVHSSNQDLRYLQQKDKSYSFAKLFERKGSYVVGIKSSKTWFTEYSDTVIIPDAMDFFYGLKFKEPAITPYDVLLTRTDLEAITNKRDLYVLMSNVKGMKDGSYVVDGTVMDKQFSRVYGFATSISPDTRTDLGRINYDMDSGLQSIVFNFININKYPLHRKLVLDKKTFRAELMESLDVDYDKIKQLLSAADNGQRKKNYIGMSEQFESYVGESEEMVDEFLEVFKNVNPKMYERAVDLAKPIFRKKWNKKDTKYDHIPTKVKDKYSVFFFCWTQVEREIRNVMVSMFQDMKQVWQVHDAVYSIERVSIKEMQDRIQDELGLKIGISN